MSAQLLDRIESTCVICREPVWARNAFNWTHEHGDVNCGTGDGSTAYPESGWRDQLPTAVRTKLHEAKRAFEAGATVLVHDGGEVEFQVYPVMMRHTRETATWEWLESMRIEWRHRHPRQRYYVVQQ